MKTSHLRKVLPLLLHLIVSGRTFPTWNPVTTKEEKYKNKIVWTHLTLNESIVQSSIWETQPIIEVFSERKKWKDNFNGVVNDVGQSV